MKPFHGMTVKTHGLLQHDLVIWREPHQGKWATNDHDCSPNHYAKKKQKKPHASYTARARASWRAIYVYYAYELNTKLYRQFCSKHGGLRLLAGGCTIEEVEVDATVD